MLLNTGSLRSLLRCYRHAGGLTTSTNVVTVDALGELAGSWQTLHGYAAASGGRTSWPPSWKHVVISEIRLRQWMRIYSRNDPPIFHSDQIWNDRALNFWRGVPQRQQQKQQKMSSDYSDMGLVRDPKINHWLFCHKFIKYWPIFIIISLMHLTLYL